MSAPHHTGAKEPIPFRAWFSSDTPLSFTAHPSTGYLPFRPSFRNNKIDAAAAAATPTGGKNRCVSCLLVCVCVLVLCVHANVDSWHWSSQTMTHQSRLTSHPSFLLPVQACPCRWRCCQYRKPRHTPDSSCPPGNSRHTPDVCVCSLCIQS